MNLQAHEAFSELIIAIFNELHIPPGIIEKIIYVTLALKELTSRVKRMAFKGGISLTKSAIFNEGNKIFCSYGETYSCIFMIKFRHIFSFFYYI